MAKVKITETVLRDAHQSLIATRMPSELMEPILDQMDEVGYHAVECWGGATFDACLRFLKEDPWERLRMFKRHFKNTKLQMLFRGQNILGYNHYADDVVEYFVEKSIANGIDIIRIFDALNDMEFFLKVFLLFGLLLQEELCAPFLDHTHFGLENLFQLIGHEDVFLGIAALFKILTLLRFTFGHVHFVERCFELIDFFLCGIFVVSHNFFESFNHFSFAVISPFRCFLLRLWRSIHFLRLLFGR